MGPGILFVFIVFKRFFFSICQISRIPTCTPAQKLHHLSRLTSAKAGRQQMEKNAYHTLIGEDLLDVAIEEGYDEVLAVRGDFLTGAIGKENFPGSIAVHAFHLMKNQGVH